MRSPTGNNGNLKNNWRKDIFSITRFPESNTELAGYPTWIPLGGNDPNKTERHQRFYREGLRGTAKLLGVNFKARKQIDSKLTKIFPRIAEAEAEVVLASGTDYEDEARKKLDELTAAKTALYTAWYAAVDENDNLEEDLKQKHGRIANLVRARYGGPDPR